LKREQRFAETKVPEVIMKSLVQAIAVAAVLAIPAVSFAQSNQPVTRAEVRADLVHLEQAGYNPSSDQTQYPNNIQATEAKLGAQGSTASSYGGAGEGAAVSGHRFGGSSVASPAFTAGPDFNRP
jgi:Domain of unknown function (DUF4148)